MAKRTLQTEAEREDLLAAPLDKAEIRAWRASLGWARIEAAKWLKVSVRSYENWENGHRRPGHPVGIRLRMQMATEKFKSRRAP